jgi:hypothetical protein
VFLPGFLETAEVTVEQLLAPTDVTALFDPDDVAPVATDLAWTDTNTTPNEIGYEIQVSYDNGVNWEAVTITAADVTLYRHLIGFTLYTLDLETTPRAATGDTFILDTE